MHSSSRHISRPRPSFSCESCRRRKVRCGREQPKCNACQRIGESCEYAQNTVKDKSTGVQSIGITSDNEIHQDNWKGSPTISGFNDLQVANGSEAALAPPSFCGDFSSNQGRQLDGLRKDSNGSSMPATNPPILSQNHAPTWNDDRRSAQLLLASAARSFQQTTTSSSSRDSRDQSRVPAPPPKHRQLTSEFGLQHRDPMEIESSDGEISAAPQTQTQAAQKDSPHHSSLDDGKDSGARAGYRDDDNRSRPRYVESAFWAFVSGQVCT